MEEVKAKLEQIEVIAKALCHVGHIEYGRSWQDIPHDGLRIQVYTAADSDHQAAQIGDLEVAFHNTTQFELPTNVLPKLDSYIEHARKALRDTKAKRDALDKEEILKKRAERRATLERELAELNDDAAQSAKEK